ncbi:hypothetical protein BDA96_05G093400 [Sorghum bicolor]|jgi:hypothetical protein|uniref:Uncharacterized protein n=2 Tax=Sorghum bicolor TaxID=4558 RepID=A0A921UF50_SORBI|nr:hypothetical protein BDA96_05G093400 [Sorghum bicolor]KAG0529375.1 hypothetical protein BDA96_05G093400 [Sorghum bicolor]KXG28142.1 hypothetical protein SORBI_3005G090500 [Sorghum bicolor]
MENNSQPPAPAAPAAKVTPPAKEPRKTTKPSSNLELVRRKKLKITRVPSPPPPKLPVYRPPPPPRPELPSSSAAGNALLPLSSDTGFCVLNMQADPPSPDQVTMAEEGSDSEGGSGSGDDVQMLDLNFPPVSNNKEN